jgi:hypothetical protein
MCTRAPCAASSALAGYRSYFTVDAAKMEPVFDEFMYHLFKETAGGRALRALRVQHAATDARSKVLCVSGMVGGRGVAWHAVCKAGRGWCPSDVVAAATAAARNRCVSPTPGDVDAAAIRAAGGSAGAAAALTSSGNQARWHKHNVIFVINPSKVRVCACVRVL